MLFTCSCGSAKLASFTVHLKYEGSIQMGVSVHESIRTVMCVRKKGMSGAIKTFNFEATTSHISIICSHDFLNG